MECRALRETLVSLVPVAKWGKRGLLVQLEKVELQVLMEGWDQKVAQDQVEGKERGEGLESLVLMEKQEIREIQDTTGNEETKEKWVKMGHREFLVKLVGWALPVKAVSLVLEAMLGYLV